MPLVITSKGETLLQTRPGKLLIEKNEMPRNTKRKKGVFFSQMRTIDDDDGDTYIYIMMQCLCVTKNDHIPLPSWAPEAQSETPPRPCRPKVGFGLVMMMVMLYNAEAHHVCNKKRRIW